MRNILIAFVAVFVAFGAVLAEAQTTGTATVDVKKRAWNLLSGHVWTAGGRTYLNAGCQNIDPQPWGALSSTVRLQLKFYIEGSSQTPFFDTRPYFNPGRRDDGLDCDLSKGIDIVTWELPPWPQGWENQVGLRMQLISRNRNTPHLGVANNAGQTWGRLRFGNANPYPGTGLLSSDRTRVVSPDELYNPGDYQR